MMDAKMDSGYLSPGETLEDEYDVWRELLPEEVVGIMDQLLCHEVRSVPVPHGQQSTSGETSGQCDRVNRTKAEAVERLLSTSRWHGIWVILPPKLSLRLSIWTVSSGPFQLPLRKHNSTKEEKTAVQN